MKTGETWKRGSASGIAVVSKGWVAIICDVGGDPVLNEYPTETYAVGCGWQKTHEADGTPVRPVPKEGELWFFSVSPGWVHMLGGKLHVTFSDGSRFTLTALSPTRRLYPPEEQ